MQRKIRRQLDTYKLDPNTVNTGARIGRGASSFVYKGTIPSIKNEVAIKLILPTFFEDHNSYGRFIVELSFLKTIDGLKGPNVLKFYGYADHGFQKYSLVMELAPFGSLDAHLKDLASNESARYKVMKGAVRGVRFLHENSILHCDVKPQNLFVFDNWEVKWGDFGSANYDTGSSLKIGSWSYMAPEVMSEGMISQKSDIFSLSTLFCSMLVGHAPHSQITSVAQLIQHVCGDGGRETLPSTEQESKERQIIVWGWEHNPLDRPSAEMLYDELEKPQEQLISSENFRKKLVQQGAINNLKEFIKTYKVMRASIKLSALEIKNNLFKIDLEKVDLTSLDRVMVGKLIAQLELLLSDIDLNKDGSEGSLSELADTLREFENLFAGIGSDSSKECLKALNWLMLHNLTLTRPLDVLDSNFKEMNFKSHFVALITCVVNFKLTHDKMHDLVCYINDEDNWESIRFLLPKGFNERLKVYSRIVYSISDVFLYVSDMAKGRAKNLASCGETFINDIIKKLVDISLSEETSMYTFRRISDEIQVEITKLLSSPDRFGVFGGDVQRAPQSGSVAPVIKPQF